MRENGVKEEVRLLPVKNNGHINTIYVDFMQI